MARLLVVKGEDEGRQFELADAAVSLGRDASSRIRLRDTEISRRHAEFRKIEGEYQVVDVGSANGTFVNNQRIQKSPLKPGDQIAVGQSVLVFSRDSTGMSDLGQKINMIARGDIEIVSAIVKTIGESEGSRLLSKPERGSPWLQSQLANLAIVYEAGQATSHILDIPQLLQRLLELVFRSIPADRGCVMLCVDQGEPEPKALLWRKGDHPEQMLLSSTIVDYVLREKQGVLLSDAARDERFTKGRSIVQFGIREVLCVPMRGRHETLGVLYLDTQLSAAELAAQTAATCKFNEDHLALAIAIAHQAALAVEETRYHHALLQAERLAAIGQTVAALSHHIKNILQGLRSGSEILKMGFDQKNDKLIQQGWRVAEKNQGKIYDLVMDMLNFSKERVPNVEPGNVNDLVEEVVELLSPRALEHGATIEKALAADLPVVAFDSDGIHRAMLNILGNALDAVEGRPTPKVAIATRLDAGFAVITVDDNGVGIAAEKLREVFKPFVSTKGARGTGLGLPVSQKILREHGGDLLVESQPGVGSRFTLKLPVKSPLVQDLSATMLDGSFVAPEPD